MQTLQRGKYSGLTRPEIKLLMQRQIPLSQAQIVDLIVEGHMKSQERTLQHATSGIRLRRIAGQALDLNELATRAEISQTLENLVEDGVLINLGHGGENCMKCGAVAAKQAQISAMEKGGNLSEVPSVLSLLDHVSPRVKGYESPHAEMINAADQIAKILSDPEFSKIVALKKLTAIAAVFTDSGTKFEKITLSDGGTVQMQELTDSDLASFPKLLALRENLAKGIEKAKREDISLTSHYAFATVVSDPYEYGSINDIGSPIEVAGFSCVDARLHARTPSNPATNSGIGPNQIFGVTADIRLDGASIIGNDIGSIDYALKHVNGVNRSPIFLTFATSLDAAAMLADALLQNPHYADITRDGKTIMMASFNRTYGLNILSPEVGRIHLSYTGIL